MNKPANCCGCTHTHTHTVCLLKNKTSIFSYALLKLFARDG